MLLVITCQPVLGGIACGMEIINGNDGDMSNMACCTQGKSPTGSIVAQVCCETLCGESTSGSEFDFTPQALTLSSPIINYRIADFYSLNSHSDSAFSAFFRSREDNILSQNPPDLFLSYSTFLI